MRVKKMEELPRRKFLATALATAAAPLVTATTSSALESLMDIPIDTSGIEPQLGLKTDNGIILFFAPYNKNTGSIPLADQFFGPFSPYFFPGQSDPSTMHSGFKQAHMGGLSDTNLRYVNSMFTSGHRKDTYNVLIQNGATSTSTLLCRVDSIIEEGRSTSEEMEEHGREIKKLTPEELNIVANRLNSEQIKIYTQPFSELRSDMYILDNNNILVFVMDSTSPTPQHTLFCLNSQTNTWTKHNAQYSEEAIPGGKGIFSSKPVWITDEGKLDPYAKYWYPANNGPAQRAYEIGQGQQKYMDTMSILSGDPVYDPVRDAKQMRYPGPCDDLS